jgi:carboxylesterase type B
VTIAGGSAGGGSVVAQLFYHRGEVNPPYRAAIAGKFQLSSPLSDTKTNILITEFPWGQPFHNTTYLNAQYDELLQAAGVTDLADLRALDYSSLVNATLESYTRAYEKMLYGYGDFHYGPYVDGAVIQKLPSEAFTDGSWSKVPLIVNHNFAEGKLVPYPLENTSLIIGQVRCLPMRR